nr:hypothetical protein CFP56_20371 [Quercus suber]
MLHAAYSTYTGSGAQCNGSWFECGHAGTFSGSVRDSTYAQRLTSQPNVVCFRADLGATLRPAVGRRACHSRYMHNIGRRSLRVREEYLRTQLGATRRSSHRSGAGKDGWSDCPESIREPPSRYSHTRGELSSNTAISNSDYEYRAAAGATG